MRLAASLMAVLATVTGPACSRSPIEPAASTEQSATAGSNAPCTATGCAASLTLAIDPNPIVLGPQIMRNGAKVYPATWSLQLNETAGVTVTVRSWYFELRAESGNVLFRSTGGGWTTRVPGGSIWRLFGQQALVGDPQAMGQGKLLVRLQAVDGLERLYEVSAEAAVVIQP